MVTSYKRTSVVCLTTPSQMVTDAGEEMIRKIPNVIGDIAGTVTKDDLILIGNCHDKFHDG